MPLGHSPVRRLSLLGIFLVLVLPVPAKPKSQAQEWAEGPVRYILRREEIKVFKALESEEDRLRFVDQFWQRRDPSPGTPENEYRNLFWTRVKYANERYADTAAPGWKSDRGKLYILCGAPDTVENMQNADTQSGPTAGHGLIRWIYERRPCGTNKLGPAVVVPFVREVTGEYRLSTDPKLSSLYFREDDLNNETLLATERWLEQIGGTMNDRSELAVMADLGTLQADGARPEERIIERVETSEAYGSRPLDTKLARFRYPRGETLVVFTVAEPVVGPNTTPSIIARFVPRDPAKAKRFVGEESFRLEGVGATRVAQARVVLEPGVWDVTILSVETGDPRSGVYRGTVEIRPTSEALTLSDLVLASTLEPVPYRSLISYDEPYLVGAFRVVPKIDSTIARGAPVNLFFEVTGGAPPYRIAAQLEGQEQDASWRELGAPLTRESGDRSQGFTLDTKPTWPLGEYRLRVHVQDGAGTSAADTIGFSLR